MEKHQYTYKNNGGLAQLGERLNGIQKVRGSNPLSSTILLFIYQPFTIFHGLNITALYGRWNEILTTVSDCIK